MSPILCDHFVGSLMFHKVIMNKGCETEPLVYRPSVEMNLLTEKFEADIQSYFGSGVGPQGSSPNLLPCNLCWMQKGNFKSVFYKVT